MPSPTAQEPSTPLVSSADVRAAAERIAGVALRTPLLPLTTDGLDGPRVWIKPESLQPIGAFKIRGAYNALAQLGPAERAAGVVTHSSGNHAQGVALAASLLGLRAVIVMPDDAPAVKVAGVRSHGAEIDVVGPSNEERIARADTLAAERGLTLVPSYDDDRIIAGHGTIGLEIIDALARAGRPAGAPLTVLVPIGGGGLAAGVAVAVKGARPSARVVGVEPELAADARDSLRDGRIVRWAPELTARTMADGVRTSALGERPFLHLKAHLDGVVTVSEPAIAAAVVDALGRARLVLEPSGALTLAAWRTGAAPVADIGDVVLVATGGNIDLDVLRDLLAAAGRSDGA